MDIKNTKETPKVVLYTPEHQQLRAKQFTGTKIKNSPNQSQNDFNTKLTEIPKQAQQYSNYKSSLDDNSNQRIATRTSGVGLNKFITNSIIRKPNEQFHVNEPTNFNSKLMAEIISENELCFKEKETLNDLNFEYKQKYENLKFDYVLLQDQLNRQNKQNELHETAKTLEFISQNDTNIKRQINLIQTLEAEVKKKDHKITEKAIETRLFQQQLYENQIETEKFRKENDRLKTINEDFKGKLRFLEKENQEFKNDAEVLQLKLKKFQNRQQGKESDAQIQCEQEINVLNKLLKESISTVNGKDEIIRQLQNKLKENLNETQQLKNVTKKKPESVMSSNSVHESKLNNLNLMTQYENLKDRFDELKITNKKLENEKTELNKENKLIKIQLENSRKKTNENQLKSDKIGNEKFEIAMFENQRLSDELICAKIEIESLKNDLATIKDTSFVQKNRKEIKVNNQTITNQDTSMTKTNQKESNSENQTRKNQNFARNDNSVMNGEDFNALKDTYMEVKNDLRQIIYELMFKNIKLNKCLLNKNVSRLVDLMDSKIIQDNKNDEYMTETQRNERRLKNEILNFENYKGETNEQLIKNDNLVFGHRKSSISGIDILQKRVSTTNNLDDVFYSLNEDDKQSLKIELEMKKKEDEFSHFMDDVIGLMNHHLASSIGKDEKMRFLQNEVKTMMSENGKLKKELGVQKEKTKQLKEENEDIIEELEDVKKKRKELIHFVKEKMLPKEQEK